LHNNKMCFGITNHQKWFEITKVKIMSHHYKKTWSFKKSNLIKMFTLTKGDGYFD
jgi:hypothetical protein